MNGGRQRKLLLRNGRRSWNTFFWSGVIGLITIFVLCVTAAWLDVRPSQQDALTLSEVNSTNRGGVGNTLFKTPKRADP